MLNLFRSKRARLLLSVAAALALLTPLAYYWQASLIPDTYDMADMGYADYGGGPRMDHAAHHGTPVAELVEETTGPADVAVTLTTTRDGDDYFVNGSSPGPEIRATQGDLVEVTLVNDNVEDGTTLHWHGIDVPNAMDGVAGVTQDAVGPGEEFVYRFVADQVGTYWYHSHQVSHAQVVGGLLGAIVIEERAARIEPQPDTDIVAVLHRYDDGPTVNGETDSITVDAAPGDFVRLRAVNTDNGVGSAWVSGTPYQVLAVDGADVNQPEEIEGQFVAIPAGGRVDLGFVVPTGGARVDFSGTNVMVFGSDPTDGSQGTPPDDALDLLSYGEPADIGFDPAQADRHFDYTIDKKPGFFDGKPGMWWSINGHLFPDVPMYMVEEGDVVVFRLQNKSGEAHPMHHHGHHAVVLSRDGEPATGSPWWIDSLEVKVGESYDIAFVANNPGFWMDHCHNLPHASEGLVAHMMYGGVSSSFKVGDDAGNEPE